MVKIIIGKNGSGKTTYLQRKSNLKNSLIVNAKALTPGESIFSKLLLKDVIGTSRDKNYLNNVKYIINYFSMNDLWNKKIGLFSGGELKIVNISMMLGFSPKEISLDEPERDLSEINIKKLVELVNLLSRKIKFTIVTHNKIIFEEIKNKEIYEMNNYSLRKTKKERWD